MFLMFYISNTFSFIIHLPLLSSMMVSSFLLPPLYLIVFLPIPFSTPLLLFYSILFYSTLLFSILSQAHSTIGGYVCAQAGEIPSSGETIVFSGYRFTVVSTFVCVSVCVSVYLCVYLSMNVSVYLPVCVYSTSSCVSLCFHESMSFCCLSVCISVALSTYVHPAHLFPCLKSFCLSSHFFLFSCLFNSSRPNCSHTFYLAAFYHTIFFLCSHSLTPPYYSYSGQIDVEDNRRIISIKGTYVRTFPNSKIHSVI